jgi:hypothetical protein
MDIQLTPNEARVAKLEDDLAALRHSLRRSSL